MDFPHEGGRSSLHASAIPHRMTSKVSTGLWQARVTVCLDTGISHGNAIFIIHRGARARHLTHPHSAPAPAPAPAQSSDVALIAMFIPEAADGEHQGDRNSIER